MKDIKKFTQIIASIAGKILEYFIYIFFTSVGILLTSSDKI
jgi:hypothetical protein